MKIFWNDGQFCFFSFFLCVGNNPLLICKIILLKTFLTWIELDILFWIIASLDGKNVILSVSCISFKLSSISLLTTIIGEVGGDKPKIDGTQVEDAKVDKDVVSVIKRQLIL